MIEYRELSENEICTELFANFIRRQQVTRCWRKEKGTWVIKDAPFVDDWGQEEYKVLVSCLKNTVNTGGFVCGVFADGVLKGFASVESELFGESSRYLDLTSIHVSADMRGKGLGTGLFTRACRWARLHGAKKLYISAHSAVETQAFYRAMGCTEAQEYCKKHSEAEPFDCQLERLL